MTRRAFGVGRCLALAASGCIALAVAIGLGGCNAVRWDTSWPEPRPLGADLPTYRPPREADAPDAAAAFEEPTGALTLREAQGHALLGNPRLTAHSWDVRAHEARTLQAALPTNPELSVRTEDVAGSGDFAGIDQAESTISLGQELQLGGKRSKRHRMADLEEDVAGWDYEAARLDVLTDTTQAFTAVLAGQQRLALDEELVQLAQEALNLVVTEIEEGKVRPIERTRAKIAVASAELRRDQTRAELLTARSNLAAQWGSEQEIFLVVDGDLETVREPPTLASMFERIDRNPAIARWATEVERRRAALAVAKAERIPNVFVEAGYRRLTSVEENSAVFGVGLPLPLVDRNQGGILEATYDLKKAEVEERAARLAIRTELAAADDRLRAAFAEVTSLRNDILPDAESVYTQLLADFDTGDSPYDDLLDAQRVLFVLRSQYVERLEDFHVAAADVERLIGGPLWSPAPP